MVPLCGDDKLADISEPYKSVGNFMYIDPWIVNVSNCVRKRNNRIKIAIIYLTHISSAIGYACYVFMSILVIAVFAPCA